MKILSNFPLLLLMGFVCLCNFGYRTKIQEQKAHIEYLEEYIQENHLPLPAFPLRDGPVVFETDVPVCEGINEQENTVDNDCPACRLPRNF